MARCRGEFLLPCPGCRCHVKSAEGACPHCGLEFTAARTPAPSRGAPIHARRIAFAAALAGLNAACGGRINSETADDNSVAGTCVGPTDGGVTPSCAMLECHCGPLGFCSYENDLCTLTACGLNQYLNSQGECANDYWFDNVNLPTTTPASCYGAPPARS